MTSFNTWYINKKNNDNPLYLSSEVGHPRNPCSPLDLSSGHLITSTKKATSGYLLHPLGSTAISFSERQIKVLLTQRGGQPANLQRLAKKLYRWLTQQPTK